MKRIYLKALSLCLILLTLVFMLVFNSSCHPFYGFVESEFELAQESRMPKWVTIPSNLTRADVSLKITFYTFGKVKNVVYGPLPQHKILYKTIGTHRWHPITEKRGYVAKPSYLIITVNGTDEIFEQRRLEPILYVTDKVQ